MCLKKKHSKHLTEYPRRLERYFCDEKKEVGDVFEPAVERKITFEDVEEKKEESPYFSSPEEQKDVFEEETFQTLNRISKKIYSTPFEKWH